MVLIGPRRTLRESRELTAGPVTLRHPAMSDFEAWARLRAESRDFLTPWEPTWPAGDLSRAAYRERLRRYAREIREDLAYPFFVFRDDGATLAGSCILSNVRRGVAQIGTIGYWIGKPHARRGLMGAAVARVLGFAFDELKLHRVEAACLPSNGPSRSLLKSVGFKEEGYARAYLKINGRWEDHLLFAILEGDPRG